MASKEGENSPASRICIYSPRFRRLREENLEFKASLDNLVVRHLPAVCRPGFSH